MREKQVNNPFCLSLSLSQTHTHTHTQNNMLQTHLHILVMNANTIFIIQEHFQKLRIESAMSSSEPSSKQVFYDLPVAYDLAFVLFREMLVIFTQS